MWKLDLAAVRRNAQAADSLDLLDRLTIYAKGMEPDALRIIAEVLAERGIGREEVEEHRQERNALEPLRIADGMVRQCTLCREPAVARAWRWHRLFGKVPTFPRRVWVCEQHAPALESRL
jgi:hypothetical protein